MGFGSQYTDLAVCSECSAKSRKTKNKNKKYASSVTEKHPYNAKNSTRDFVRKNSYRCWFYLFFFNHGKLLYEGCTWLLYSNSLMFAIAGKV